MSAMVIVLSGISGSGKSTYAARLCKAHLQRGWPAGIVSADHFFESQNGNYVFDANRLNEAHATCFRGFLATLAVATAGAIYGLATNEGYTLVIVDNTNLSAEEIAPYVLGAQAYRCEVEIHTLDCSVDTAARNTHGVSRKSLKRQQERLSTRRLMPSWKNIEVKLASNDSEDGTQCLS